MTYCLLDAGDQKKLEQFGPYVLERPASVALWKPQEIEAWQGADASFSREKGNRWRFNKKIPSEWIAEIEGVKFKISPTDFGHLGLFPEHLQQCLWMHRLLEEQKKAPEVLNLFAYSGAATLFAARAGAKVCHLDASKGMVAWARENAALNGLENAPIRWIIDDVFKFLGREERRGVRYDGIILDPPSFGRGSKGESFKIERDIRPLLEHAVSLLKERPLFMIFSTHTPGITPLVMRQLLSDVMAPFGGQIEEGEMAIVGKGGLVLPSGTYARWKR